MASALLFSVEHGNNKVPPEYAGLFAGHEELLGSHRGHDPGAAEFAARFATRFHAPVETAEVTRLLVDQNRSLHNRKSLFSEFTKRLPPQEKQAILDKYYWPYRRQIDEHVGNMIAESGQVLHLAIHSFTPELYGKVRKCDIGLMYDPSRPREKEFSLRWQQQIHRLDGKLRVRRNYPYQGIGDGVTSALRRHFSPEQYTGLQIEVNQRFPFGERESWKHLQKVVIEGFAATLAEGGF
ncbi:MAG: N-formylglutamate amidohydrolase [Desulfuromonas sp.]|nr:MAG: N-formylglutamate amidohydrolase [Desulfuromonas sp.]